MFFDFLSLQNQNPPVLPHEVTLQNQGLAYSQGFTNGSPTSALPNQTLRSPCKNSPWNLWKSLKLGKTLRNTVNHLEKVWKTTKTPRPWFHRIQSLINPLDFDFVEGETVGKQGHLAMFFDKMKIHLFYPMKSLYKIKVSPTHKVLQMGQNQISYLTSPYKIKNHCMLGNRGFRGTILYRITVLSSQHLSRLQNQDLMDPKKDGFMKIILLQNQESEFLQGVVHYKIKDLGILWDFFLLNQFPSRIKKNWKPFMESHYRIRNLWEGIPKWRIFWYLLANGVWWFLIL